ncbi:MAG: DUF1848 domain-containing protein [Lentisphaerae bacterium]|nr:DUF1848 domain-containing protein [Lentisphaerota bacterium]
MIISASRRTDIPAFYPDWFMNRVRAGSCVAVNPFNPSQRRVVSLQPGDVEAVVFWTRNPEPLEQYLHELDRLGIGYVFLFTLNAYPACLEPGAPGPDRAVRTFRRLSACLGPQRMAWRYDPIILSRDLDAAWHAARFDELASALEGAASRAITSFLDMYRKTARRLRALKDNLPDIHPDPASHPAAPELLRTMAASARKHGMALQTCCEPGDFTASGSRPGACVDAAWLSAALGRPVAGGRDQGQRPACLCSLSVDIGAPDTCLHDCAYCYATSSRKAAINAFSARDPASPSLRPDRSGRSG